MEIEEKNDNSLNIKPDDRLLKRKRINRIKIFIIAGILLLFLSSMILNIVLMIKIYKIEKQLDGIYSYEQTVLINSA